MTALVGAHKPYVFRNASYTIGATDYANAIAKCRLVPTTNVQTLVTSVPEGVYQDVDTTQWEWEITGVQDWAAAGLAKLFFDNNGLGLDVVMTPNLGGPSMTFTITSMPVDFGGDQGTMNTFDATFPVQGQPAWDDGESS